MRKRALLFVAAVVLLACVALTAWMLLRPADPISETSARAIRNGMERPAVEALLGGPPGDYRSAGNQEWRLGMPARPGLTPMFWFGDGGAVLVYFNAEGRAEFSEFIPAPTFSNTVSQLFRRWFGF